MSAMLREVSNTLRPPPVANQGLRWRGRQHLLRWSYHADGSQLRLDLIDSWTGTATPASCEVPGWLCREDQLVLCDAELVSLLAGIGIVEPHAQRLTGANGGMLARLTAAGLRSVDFEQLDTLN